MSSHRSHHTNAKALLEAQVLNRRRRELRKATRLGRLAKELPADSATLRLLSHYADDKGDLYGDLRTIGATRDAYGVYRLPKTGAQP